MRRKIFPGPSAILTIFLIPYLCTILLNGMDTALINRKFNVELFLPVVVAAQISEDYEAETIKAQAVIARSNFYRKMDSRESLMTMFQEISKKVHPTYYRFDIPSSVYEEAVTETEGMILMWQKQLKLVPYHEISAGSTRDGEEVFRSEEYSYLKSVDSSGDKDADHYLNSAYVKISQMPEELTVVSRDSADYVTELSADGNILEGEAFRQGLGLASSNFTIQKIGDSLRFLCKGKGHGLGFSQYGANTLAKKEITFKEILETYFPEMEISDISNVSAG